MKYSDFESQYPDLVAKQNPVTLRQWKRRDKVPDHVTKSVTGVTKPVTGVTKSVTKPASVTKSVTKPASVTESVTKSVTSVTAGVTTPDPPKNSVAKPAPIDVAALPPLTPEYCAQFGYHISPAQPWERIVGIFESARRCMAAGCPPGRELRHTGAVTG